MTTIIVATGSFLTLIGFLCVQNPEKNPESLFIQGLFIIVPYLLAGAYILLTLLRHYPALSKLFISRSSRFTSAVLMALLFVLPFGKRLLLNDAAFVFFLLVIGWCWLAWYYFLEIGYRRKSDPD